MRQIIDFKSKEIINFTKRDLPLMVHGAEHSGASLLSITIASLLHKSGNKLCIFTAYPMAKEEFLKQIDKPESVFYLENYENFKQALNFETIIVKSGDIDLFLKVIASYEDLSDRIVFIKNIETINMPIWNIINKYTFMVSGDFAHNSLQKDFKDFKYQTEILLTPLSGREIPILEKYQAYYQDKIIIVS